MHECPHELRAHVSTGPIASTRSNRRKAGPVCTLRNRVLRRQLVFLKRKAK
jgi:hypothetical protein